VIAASLTPKFIIEYGPEPDEFTAETLSTGWTAYEEFRSW
jgi:hypothetical protein